jgi:hypothetical protein
MLNGWSRPGAGHFVAAAPGFVNRPHEFLVSAA